MYNEVGAPSFRAGEMVMICPLGDSRKYLATYTSSTLLRAANGDLVTAYICERPGALKNIYGAGEVERIEGRLPAGLEQPPAPETTDTAALADSVRWHQTDDTGGFGVLEVNGVYLVAFVEESDSGTLQLSLAVTGGLVCAISLTAGLGLCRRLHEKMVLAGMVEMVEGTDGNE